MSSPAQQAASEPRDSRLTVRFGATELARVERRAGALGLKPSAYLRGLAGEATRSGTSKDTASPAAGASAGAESLLSPEQVAEVHRLRVDVKRETVNLNQLLRLAHRGDLDMGELEQVIRRLGTSNERVIDALTERWPA